MRQVQREMSATYGAVLSRDTNNPGQDETLAACDREDDDGFQVCIAAAPSCLYWVPPLCPRHAYFDAEAAAVHPTLQR